MLDFWRGKITLRRMWVLISRLPEDSAFIRAVTPYPLWSQEAHLLATLGDITLGVNGNDIRLPRPGDKERVDTWRSERRRKFDERQKLAEQRRLAEGSA